MASSVAMQQRCISHWETTSPMIRRPCITQTVHLHFMSGFVDFMGGFRFKLDTLYIKTHFKTVTEIY